MTLKGDRSPLRNWGGIIIHFASAPLASPSLLDYYASMNDSTYKIIKATIDGDNSLSAEDRADILSYCKTPRVISATSPAQPPMIYLTPKAVASNLSVCLRSVHRWISTGQLLSKKFGECRRIPLDAYEKFTASH
jgi:hypothetical protein